MEHVRSIDKLFFDLTKAHSICTCNGKLEPDQETEETEAANMELETYNKILSALYKNDEENKELTAKAAATEIEETKDNNENEYVEVVDSCDEDKIDENEEIIVDDEMEETQKK